MKKSRAASGRGTAGRASAPRRPQLPPALPNVAELEAHAAEPSLPGAWWTSLQITEHVFSSVARTDPRTGDCLPQSLLELLRALNQATVTGCRPFPHDLLFVAAEFAAAPLAQLLEHHRTRIVRTHEQLPFHLLREMDNRSLAWLARQPGRNIREKLSGRTHALGVKRERTADSAENRLLRAFAKLVVRRVSARLSHVEAYDGNATDRARASQLAQILYLCDERMRRSDLAEVPASAQLQPNNVLLSDPLYSKVFRAWKWLRDDEERLRRSWPEVFNRVRTMLCWLVAAQLTASGRVIVPDTLGRVVLGRDGGTAFGLEVIGSEGKAPVWRLNPPVQLLVLPNGDRATPFEVRLSLQEEFLLTHIAALNGRGLMQESSVTALAFEIKAEPERLTAGRGITVSVDGLDIDLRSASLSWADVSGLKSLADQMAQVILDRCGARGTAAKRQVNFTPVVDGARIGIELAGTALRVNDGQIRRLVTLGWSAAHDLPGEGRIVEWLDGRSDRVLAAGAAGRSVWTIGDALDPEPDADIGTLALAMRRVVGAVAQELGAPASARVAYAVPDSVDEFSQRSMRAGVNGALGNAIPVWRSVASALAWQLSPSYRYRRARPGDHVIVVDTEFSSVAITLLVARHDAKLERCHSGSLGIYWERKPPLPPDEQLEQLGWARLLRTYAVLLVQRAADGGLSTAEQKDIVNDLLRTGTIFSLMEKEGSVLVPLPPERHPSAQAMKLFHDQDHLRAEVNRWLQDLAVVIGNELKTLAAYGAGTHLLLIGGPCALSGFADSGVSKLSVMLQSWGNFRIASVSADEVAAGTRECLLRVDSGCIAWKEWLPDLALEVVRDGHYGQLPLLGRGTIVDPFLGTTMDFAVPETLTLARGQSWYSFPLIVGRQGRRPLAWEARLESAAFPLDHDVRAVLRLAYRYGLDTSYELRIEPESPVDAPFARVQARWIPTGDSPAPTTAREPPAFAVAAWNQSDATQFVDAASSLARLGDDKFGRFLFAVTRGCWSQGRSIATAPSSVRTVFAGFCASLLRRLPNEGVSLQQIPRELEVLSLLHEDAPSQVGSLVLALDDAAADDPIAYRKTAALLSTLVGDAAGYRHVYLQRLLDRLLRHSGFESFNAGMASSTMGALGNAMWRHPNLMNTLAANAGGTALLIEQCRRSLQNLLDRVPSDVATDAHREKLSKMYARPFRDACEILLALLRIEENEATFPLRCGSSSANAIAKSVRQLDSRFSACRVELRWRVRLAVKIPESLRRMSPVAVALNSYLSDGGGTNLVHVTGADID